MFNKIKSPYSFFVSIALIVTILICHSSAIKTKDNNNPFPITWDVYGYYLYLPATLIYNDLGLQNDEWLSKTREKYQPSPSFYQVAQGKDGKKVIIYNVGYSIINAPAFIIANWIANAKGYDADGFSKPYQLALLYTALLISIIGIFMFRKISLTFFSDKITAILILCILLGTNYFYQATFDGVMPHNILFTINCFIIWYTIKWHENKKIKYITLLAFFIGLASICRPTELIWLIVPLLWKVDSWGAFIIKIKYLFQQFFQLLVFLVVLFSFLFIQFAYLKYTTGNYFEFNFHTETFSFLDPYTFKFLFSYKKGWLLYTPIMLFGIAGFYYFKKKNFNLWLPLFLFFVINLYVVSSWECWWYAYSFSQRPMVEIYPMMLLPFGYFISHGLVEYKRWKLFCFSIMFFLMIFLNLFQTWQYKNSILDPELMTKEYYWKIFLKTKIEDDARNYLSINRYQTDFNLNKNYLDNYFKKEAFNLDFEDMENKYIVDTNAANGKKCFLLDNTFPYSPTYEQKYHDITCKSYLWVRVSLSVYLTAPYSESYSGIVVSTESNNKSYKYSLFALDSFNIQPNVWTQVYANYLTPEIRHDDDIIKAYFWNNSNNAILIDDLKVEFYEPKKDFK